MPRRRTWDEAVESCLSLHREALAVLSERSALMDSSSLSSSRHSRSAALEQRAREGRRAMAEEAAEAEAALKREEGALTAGERLRRRRQLEEIRNKERHLSDLLFRHRPQQGSRRSERDLLLGGSDGGVANLGTVGWGAADEGSALQEEEEEGGEEGAKMKSQDDVLREQDKGLDSLHLVIGRQRRLAEAIGGEAESQVELLGGLGEDVERAAARAAQATRGVTDIGRRSGGTGRYWAAIVVLLLLIVVVAAMPGRKGEKSGVLE